MKFKKYSNDLILIDYSSIKDSRGNFDILFKKEDYSKIIKKNFLQENLSISYKKNTIRGIHLQLKPYEQAKLITVIKGSILDVVIDLRKNSKSFKKIFYFQLSENKKKQLYIPRGFGHGFRTLSSNTIVNYKVDNVYSPENEISIIYNDEELNINWSNKKLKKYISKKDKNGLTFKEFYKKYYE